ncbi:MAG: hypothetical protein NTW10_07840 [Bacteroidetes bacterium]|nr:hypothetical protein [Bacteroidota bacterium]
MAKTQKMEIDFIPIRAGQIDNEMKMRDKGKKIVYITSFRDLIKVTGFHPNSVRGVPMVIQW